jgi:hypothetical protein
MASRFEARAYPALFGSAPTGLSAPPDAVVLVVHDASKLG